MNQDRIDEYIEDLKYPHLCQEALGNLVKLGKPAIPKLIEALQSEDWGIAAYAAKALGRMGNITEAAESALISVLNNSNAGRWDPDVQWWGGADVCAAEALGEIRCKNAVASLISVITDMNRPESTHKAALTALVNIAMEYRDTVPQLIEAHKKLSTPFGSWIDLEISEVLAKYDDESVIPILINCLKQRYEKERTEKVIKHLNPELKEMLSDYTPEFIKIFEKAKSYNEREGMIDALGIIGSKEAVPRLRAIIREEKTPLRENAIKALGKICDRTSMPLFIELLKDGDWIIRSNSAEALGLIGDETSVDALTEALKDENEHVRASAVLSLGLIGPKAKKAIPSLIKSLQDKNFFVCTRSADALVKINIEVAASAFKEALTSSDNQVQKIVSDKLQELKEAGKINKEQ